MARVVNEVTINGPIDQVFDVVTTPRYWLQWHPATVAVGGVTERPIALGDKIHEKAQIGAGVYEGDWTVTEHARPSRVVLSVEGSPLQIAYAFTAQGQATTFRRELDFSLEDFAPSAPNPEAVVRVMDQQSAAGLQRLKQLVEEMLGTAAPA